MDTKTIEKLQQVLAPIAQKIGETANWGWDTVMRQQYVAGVLYFVDMVFWLIGVSLGVWLIASSLRKSTTGHYFDNWEIGVVFGAVLAIVCAFGVLYSVEQGIGHLLNPSYYAIQFFISLGNPSVN